jgi:2,3-bisphosphoglycerate-independent phosphoglycerate mutase
MHDNSLPSLDLQSNFATLDEKTGIVTSRRADRHFEEEGPILCAALDGMKLPSFPQYEVRVRCGCL